MTQARLVAVDVPGLNLLLGGGVPVLKRHADSDESAVLLVRGPPGSGKTVLGTQLAGALARGLVPGRMMDVVYGCVELLPLELAAQHAGLKPPDLPERVIFPQFAVDTPEPHTGGECPIYADLLALERGEEQAGIEAAVERLLDLAERAGGKPRVVVVDSLSDGYGLGSQAPRVLADALAKLAVARGMIFILLEETIDGRPSNWSFAADVVMELGQPHEQVRARTINITKNRFGRAEPGPHRATIREGSRYTIWPEPSAYLSGGWRGFTPSSFQKHSERAWRQPQFDDPAQRWPRLHNQTVAVMGTDPLEVRRLAYELGKAGDKETELAVFLDGFLENPEASLPGRGATLNVLDPHVGGARLLADIVDAAQALAQKGLLARVILGDTHSLRLFSAQDEIVRSLMILSSLLRDASVPFIVFDSSIPSGQVWQIPAGNEVPLIANFADVKIIGWNFMRTSTVTATHGTRPRIEWQAKL